ncbi:MAG TPA: hypothetical protein VFW46_21210 [Stellaceae bacterium]|nr:hypothetical protein [Stellaceae bacterium]
MNGKRTTRQQHSQNAAAPFDGDYVGTITLMPASANNNCGGVGPFSKNVRISNNQWVLTSNSTRGETISGTVKPDGSTSGFGKSFMGGVSLKARIQGSDFTGEVASAYAACSLSRFLCSRSLTAQWAPYGPGGFDSPRMAPALD